jgi:hypothetical protein
LRQALNNLQACCRAPVFMYSLHRMPASCQPARQRQLAHQPALQCCTRRGQLDALRFLPWHEDILLMICRPQWQGLAL